MTGSSSVAFRNGQVSAPELMACTGLEVVSRLADGTLSPPSMAETLPFTLLPPEEGRIELQAIPEVRCCNLTNTIHGGWAMTMLDTAMSLAAQTTLAPGETCPSLETTAKFIRPISIHSGVMHVTGQVIARGRTIITLEGRIENADGKIHVHGTSSCMIVPCKA